MVASMARSQRGASPSSEQPLRVISPLHNGHVQLLRSHLSTQATWYRCLHGSTRKQSLSWKTSQQMLQSSSSRPLAVPAVYKMVDVALSRSSADSPGDREGLNRWTALETDLRPSVPSTITRSAGRKSASSSPNCAAAAKLRSLAAGTVAGSKLPVRPSVWMEFSPRKALSMIRAASMNHHTKQNGIRKLLLMKATVPRLSLAIPRKHPVPPSLPFPSMPKGDASHRKSRSKPKTPVMGTISRTMSTRLETLRQPAPCQGK
mmetsp:Transcript_54083/g.150007  ORF Transcript_54083/g.150007 Transcript_54083/m.150007 type:complete len:261 (-) Transcript_54083:698-1480(-)